MSTKPAMLTRAGLALLLSLVAACSARAQVTGRGSEFWGCWPRSHLSLETTADLVLMADEPVDVAVDGAFTVAAQTVRPGVPVIIPIPTTLRLGAGRTIVPSGFRIYTADPLRKFSVLLRVPHQAEASDDIARLLPTKECGVDYIVSAWPSSLPGEPSFYTVIATADNTNVSIDIPCSGVTDNVMLNAGDVYQVLCQWRDLSPDVTGANVRADQPVAVLAGNSAAYVPTDYLSGDFVVEGIPPVSRWGASFAVVPFQRGPLAVATAHDVLRLVASAPCTVQVDDGVTSTPVALTGPGAVADIAITTAVSLRSDAPILAHLLMTGIEMSDMGDPSLLGIPPREDWATAHRFFVPPDYTLGSFVTIVTALGMGATVRLDGVNVTGWAPVGPGADEFVTIALGLGSGEHLVTSDAPMGTWVHGYNDAYQLDPGLGRVPGSYAYPAPHSVPPCLIFPSAVAPSTSCVGQPVNLGESGTIGTTCSTFEYRWLADGAPVPGCDTWSPDATCSPVFQGDAVYTLEARCSTEPACVGSLPVLIVDQAAPSATVLPNPAVTCPGGPITLEADIGFILYFWTSVPPDPGVTPRGTSLNTLVATPDVDTVYSLVAADARGCTTRTDVVVTVVPDPLPPPVDASLRARRDGPNGVELTWMDIPLVDTSGYEAVFLECPTRDYRRSCGGRLPDPVTIQAAPRVTAPVAAGVQLVVQPDALLRGDLIFYKVRALSPCAGNPGPTCNGFAMQLPPCP